MGTKCKSCVDDVEIMDAWFQNGWNVGMWYWDQFADETCVRDVEYKIWNRGQRPLRWVSNDCSGADYFGIESHHEYTGKSHSIIDLCAADMRSVLQGFSGPELRFIGESLGTQLIAGCAAVLHQGGDRMAPNRVVLLEPAFTHHDRFVGKMQCEQIADSKRFGKEAQDNTNVALKQLKHAGVPIELYTSSPLIFKYLVCSNPHVYFDVHVHFKSFWCNHPASRWMHMDFQNSIGCYHDSVVSLYYLSMKSNFLPLESKATDFLPAGCWVPSAGSSLDAIKDLTQKCKIEGRPPHYVQSRGMLTFNTSDDVFRLHDPTFRISVKKIESDFSEEAISTPMTGGKTDSLSWLFVGSGIVTLALCGITIRRCTQSSTQEARQVVDEEVDEEIE